MFGLLSDLWDGFKWFFGIVAKKVDDGTKAADFSSANTEFHKLSQHQQDLLIARDEEVTRVRKECNDEVTRARISTYEEIVRVRKERDEEIARMSDRYEQRISTLEQSEERCREELSAQREATVALMTAQANMQVVLIGVRAELEQIKSTKRRMQGIRKKRTFIDNTIEQGKVLDEEERKQEEGAK